MAQEHPRPGSAPTFAESYANGRAGIDTYFPLPPSSQSRSAHSTNGNRDVGIIGPDAAVVETTPGPSDWTYPPQTSAGPSRAGGDASLVNPRPGDTTARQTMGPTDLPTVTDRVPPQSRKASPSRSIGEIQSTHTEPRSSGQVTPRQSGASSQAPGDEAAPPRADSSPRPEPYRRKVEPAIGVKGENRPFGVVRKKQEKIAEYLLHVFKKDSERFYYPASFLTQPPDSEFFYKRVPKHDPPLTRRRPEELFDSEKGTVAPRQRPRKLEIRSQAPSTSFQAPPVVPRDLSAMPQVPPVMLSGHEGSRGRPRRDKVQSQGQSAGSEASSRSSQSRSNKRPESQNKVRAAVEGRFPIDGMSKGEQEDFIKFLLHNIPEDMKGHKDDGLGLFANRQKGFYYKRQNGVLYLLDSKAPGGQRRVVPDTEGSAGPSQSEAGKSEGNKNYSERTPERDEDP